MPKPRTKVGKQRKVKKVMHEFKHSVLKSGSGAKVTKKSQAIAIALSGAGLSKSAKKSVKGKKSHRRKG